MARVAASPASTVLLTGETGTGKDLAAKAIHLQQRRAARHFVNITCSALPEHLLESELFGHERGAFTDARQQKRGLFETADGGTLFLDEIGEMTLPLQSKLLRFLEEKSFKRVGGLSDVRVDVRVIAATNRDLEEEVKAGKFRADLYYRLQVMPIRCRRSASGAATCRCWRPSSSIVSIPSSASACAACRRRPRRCSSSIRGPGNIRELRNAIERAMLLTDRRSARGLATSRRSHGSVAPVAIQAAAGRRQHRRRGAPAAGQALERSKGNQTQAAQLLRNQPRSGALPDREVRPAEGLNRQPASSSGKRGFRCSAISRVTSRRPCTSRCAPESHPECPVATEPPLGVLAGRRRAHDARE